MNVCIEINSCKQCPHFKTANQWSSDGWDRMEDWVCGKSGNTIQPGVEWHEESKIKVPEWCPADANKDQLAQFFDRAVAGLVQDLAELPANAVLNSNGQSYTPEEMVRLIRERHEDGIEFASLILILD